MQQNENFKPWDNFISGYLKGELTPEETKELLKWIRSDKANKEYFDQCSELWAVMRSATDDHGYNAGEGFRRFRQWIRTEEGLQTVTGKVRFMKRVAGYAAVFLVAFATGGFIFYHSAKNKTVYPSESVSEIDVPLGSHAIFSLTDGTVVTLNAGSSLKLDSRFGNEARIVHLEGEGYFKVAKDRQRPFTVKTSYLNITALGTEFNVKAYTPDKTIETTLVNGSAKIERVDGKGEAGITILEPNQKLTFYKESSEAKDQTRESPGKVEVPPSRAESPGPGITLVKENVNIEPVVSWKENRWIFEQESLSQIAVELERRFDVQILFDSEKLKPYRFTGTIIAEPIEQVLEVMSMTAPISYRLKGRVVTLSENANFIELNKNLYTKPN